MSIKLLALASATLAGCAAMELLEGQLPGEVDVPEAVAEVRPYPAPSRIAAERPAQSETSATSVNPSQAPAPIVNAPAPPPANPDPPQQPAQQTAPLAPVAATAQVEKKADSEPAATAPPATNAPPVQKTSSPKEPPAPQATADEARSQPENELKKAEPTAEARVADLLRRRDELIAALEEEIRLRSGEPDRDGRQSRLAQQLRLLYVLAERPDDAVRAIESLPHAEQEAFKHLIFSLSTWLAPDEEQRATLRNARVLRSLKDAAGELGAAAKLDVRNLRFCESVEGFGWYKEFPTTQFRDKQQVILYAEVENFAAERKGPDTFETELAVSYQMFDASGTLVDERDLPLDKEICRNQRRDYFLAYRIYLPDGIAAGRYRLELTVEDLKAKERYPGRKLGTGQIEFSIR